MAIAETTTIRWSAVLKGDHLLIISILCVGIWLHASSSFLAVTTLPSAGDELGQIHLINFSFSLYQLASILAGSLTAFLIQQKSLKTMILVGGVLYAIGSMSCAISSSMSVFLGGRLLQGFGGGFLFTCTFVCVKRLFPISWTPRILGIVHAVWALSAFSGPLVGGLFTTILDWRTTYWCYVIQSILFLVAVALFFEDEEVRAKKPELPPITRVCLLACVIFMVSLSGTAIQDSYSYILVVSAFCLFALFIWIDRRSHNSKKILPSQVLSKPLKEGLGHLMIFLLAASSMTYLVYGSLILEKLHGFSPLTAGLLIATESIAWGIIGLAISGIRAGLEKRLIRLGSVLITVSIIGLGLSLAHGKVTIIMLLAGLQGAGFGLLWAFTSKWLITRSPEEEKDRTSASIPTVLQFGYAIGAGILGLTAKEIGLTENVDVQTLTDLASWGFFVLIPLSLLGNLAAWKLTR